MQGLKLWLNFFFLVSFVLAVPSWQDDLNKDIRDFYSYINAPVTFSVKINDTVNQNVRFPKRYDVGYNELSLLNKNNLVVRRIPFYLDARALVTVAKENLNKGDLISEKHLTKEWMPIKEISQQTIFEDIELIGRENRFYKSKGSIFYNYDVKEPDIIKRQTECNINARSGNVWIRMPGVSLKNGAIGSTIKVLNKQTGKMLDARVIDSKNVEVIIN